MRRIAQILIVTLVVSACGEGSRPTEPAPGLTPVRPDGASRTAGGPIIRHHPGESPGPGYYALFDRTFMPNDGGWVGIVFIRLPDCVRQDFNLLDWFDRPAAFGCQLTVEGDEWWHSLSEPPPFQQRERGLGAVPVYFVRLSELATAIADDVLTISELRALPSLLIGRASYLVQIVHNSNQAANHGHETLVSSGTLGDGRTFEFRYNEKFLPESGGHVFQNTKIEFK